MANIEIHGSASMQVGALEIFLSLKIQEIGLGKETVISGFNSCPTYCDGQYTLGPFIRIWSDSQEKTKKIINVLKETGMTKLFDIETILVNSFVPKEKGKVEIHAISPENDIKASPGMLRATTWIDSEFYQVGDDVPTRDMAIVLLHSFKGGNHYAIYNDKGKRV